MKNPCKHETTKRVGGDYGFSCPVAVHPYTDENRAAHGGISYTEECCECGAQRGVNQNQLFYEFSPWGLSRAERDQIESEKATRKQAEIERDEDAAVKERGAKVEQIKRDPYTGYVEQVLVKIGDRRSWAWLSEIKAAAKQKDTGDGLVPFYRGLSRAVRDAEINERGYVTY